MQTRSVSRLLTLALLASSLLTVSAQVGDPNSPPAGPGGFGPPPTQERKLLAQFDRNADQHLDATERAAARAFLRANPASGPGGFAGDRGGPPGGGGFPGGGGPGSRSEPTSPGIPLTADDVKLYDAKTPLYEPTALRTLFLTFASADWEKELEDFHKTDVDVPATLVVDGKTYRDVGVHFRGLSSYMMIRAGQKRSLNLSLDDVHSDQTLLGFRTLNLLNSHEDASFLRAPLFSAIAQNYLPAPRVNFVRVVINGENWGIYANAEQFNKDFTQDRFHTTKGARWKVPGSPAGRGGLAYLGDDPAPYRSIYEIKSKDTPASWAKLIRLTKILAETPPAQLEAALAPILDIDGALRFLALDVTFLNGDGYWTRTSDYSIAEDAAGRLHLIPHDMNETFSFGGGPGGRGGPPPGAPPAGAFLRGGPGGMGARGNGVKTDPLIIATSETTALAAKLLAVPALRTRYLGYVRELATTQLDWARLGPLASRYHSLIEADVKRDTRKLDSYEAFTASLSTDTRSLKAFADQRRAYLLAQ
jgi:hypothetical protein